MRNNPVATKLNNSNIGYMGQGKKAGKTQFAKRKSSKVSQNSRDCSQSYATANVFSGNSSQEIVISDQNELDQKGQIQHTNTNNKRAKNQHQTIAFHDEHSINMSGHSKGRNSMDQSVEAKLNYQNAAIYQTLGAMQPDPDSEYAIVPANGSSSAAPNQSGSVNGLNLIKSPDMINIKSAQLSKQNSSNPGSKTFMSGSTKQARWPPGGNSESAADNIGAQLLKEKNPAKLSLQNINSNKQMSLQQAMIQQPLIDNYNGAAIGAHVADPEPLVEDNLQDLYFLHQNLMMNEQEENRKAAIQQAKSDQVMMDPDDCDGQLNNVQSKKKSKKGGQSRNEAVNAHTSLQSPMDKKANATATGAEGAAGIDFDELDESAKFTKVILPNDDRARRKQIQMQYNQTGQLGNIIGDYRVEKTLGQGTFGKVKQGYHIYTGQKVAIKILEKWKIDDTNDIERVAREIHILKIVQHPHIIQLYEIIETPTRLFLIMEHCCNGELFNYITSKNRLKEEEACRLFQQLISGIDYLGELGIAHRDIKPENLLLDEQKNLKIVDFGLSNTFKKNEKLMTACGSPCYAAPELIKGLEYVGQKADIWSTGVVLFCLVCGHLPFEDQNTQSLYQKILSADYQFTCYLSQEVQNLIQQVLVPEPELRYGLKQIKQNAWMKIYTPPFPIEKGNLTGNDNIHVHRKILKEMKVTRDDIDTDYTRCCIMSNVKNNLTSHYHLLVKKKSILQESLSEFSQLEMLDADADLQIAENKRKRDLRNAIPIPFNQQVRAHHSIPAAPRHNIANMDKAMNQQARYGYQLKKMNQGIANINIINQNQRDQKFNMPQQIHQQVTEMQQKQIIMADHENGKLQIYRGQANIQAQRKNNAQMKVFGINQSKKQKNTPQIKAQQAMRQGVRQSQNNKSGVNQILSPPNVQMQNDFQSFNLNDYNGLQLQNNAKSNNSKKQMYNTQVTQSISNYQKRNNTGQMVTMSPNKHASRKVVKGGRHTLNNMNLSSNKAPRHSSQIGPVATDNLQVNRSLTYQQMGPIIGAINNAASINKTNASISQMSRMSGSENNQNPGAGTQGQKIHKQVSQPTVPGNQSFGNSNMSTIQNSQKRQSVLTQYQSKFQTINNNKIVGTVTRQNLRQSGGRLNNSSQNRINQQAFTTTQQIGKQASFSGQGHIMNINEPNASNAAPDLKKKQIFTTKSKLKKSFQEFQNEFQSNPQPQQNPQHDEDVRQQMLNQMLSSKNDPQSMLVNPAANSTGPTPGAKGQQRISKKHVRANSSANQYTTGQPLAPGLEASKSTAAHTQAGAGQAAQINGTQNSIVDGRVQRDQQNITNSIIISNSQILFQDMGNGKILPMQLNQALGTIQPNTSHQNQQMMGINEQPQNNGMSQTQSAMAHYQNRPANITSHAGQQMNSKSNRQQRRKNAQSSRFNTLIQDYSDGAGAGMMHTNESMPQMTQDYQQNKQKWQNQRNQFKGVSMSLGISKDHLSVKGGQNALQFQNKIPTVNTNQTGHTGPRTITGQSQQANSQAFQSKEVFQREAFAGNQANQKSTMSNNKQSRKTTRANTNVINHVANESRTPALSKATNLIPVSYKGTKNSRNMAVNTIAVNQGNMLKQESQPRSGPQSFLAGSTTAPSANYSTQPMQQQLNLINEQENNQNRPPQSEFLNNIDVKNQTQKNIQQNIQHINNKIYQMKAIGGNNSKQASNNNIPKAKSSSQGLHRKNFQNKSMDQGNQHTAVQQKKKLAEQQQRQQIKDNFLGQGQNYADQPGIHATLEPSRSMLAYQKGSQSRHGVNNSVSFSLNPSIGNIGTTLQPNASVNENMVRNLRMQKIQQKQTSNGKVSLRNSTNFNNY